MAGPRRVLYVTTLMTIASISMLLFAFNGGAVSAEAPDEPFPLSIEDIPSDMPERMQETQRLRFCRAWSAWSRLHEGNVKDTGCPYQLSEPSTIPYMVGTDYVWADGLYDAQEQIRELVRNRELASYYERQVAADITKVRGSPEAGCHTDVTTQKGGWSYEGCVAAFDSANAKWRTRNSTPTPTPEPTFTFAPLLSDDEARAGLLAIVTGFSDDNSGTSS